MADVKNNKYLSIKEIQKKFSFLDFDVIDIPKWFSHANFRYGLNAYVKIGNDFIALSEAGIKPHSIKDDKISFRDINEGKDYGLQLIKYKNEDDLIPTDRIFKLVRIEHNQWKLVYKNSWEQSISTNALEIDGLRDYLCCIHLDVIYSYNNYEMICQNMEEIAKFSVEATTTYIIYIQDSPCKNKWCLSYYDLMDRCRKGCNIENWNDQEEIAEVKQILDQHTYESLQKSNLCEKIREKIISLVISHSIEKSLFRKNLGDFVSNHAHIKYIDYDKLYVLDDKNLDNLIKQLTSPKKSDDLEFIDFIKKHCTLLRKNLQKTVSEIERYSTGLFSTKLLSALLTSYCFLEKRLNDASISDKSEQEKYNSIIEKLKEHLKQKEIISFKETSEWIKLNINEFKILSDDVREKIATVLNVKHDHEYTDIHSEKNLFIKELLEFVMPLIKTIALASKKPKYYSLTDLCTAYNCSKEITLQNIIDNNLTLCVKIKNDLRINIPKHSKYYKNNIEEKSIVNKLKKRTWYKLATMNPYTGQKTNYIEELIKSGEINRMEKHDSNIYLDIPESEDEFGLIHAYKFKVTFKNSKIILDDILVPDYEITKLFPEMCVNNNKENKQILGRPAIVLQFKKISKHAWDKHFAREEGNGLKKCRVTPQTGRKVKVYYDLDGICKWLIKEGYYTQKEINEIFKPEAAKPESSPLEIKEQKKAVTANSRDWLKLKCNSSSY